jgi:hypothetical protein
VALADVRGFVGICASSTPLWLAARGPGLVIGAELSGLEVAHVEPRALDVEEEAAGTRRVSARA